MTLKDPLRIPMGAEGSTKGSRKGPKGARKEIYRSLREPKGAFDDPNKKSPNGRLKGRKEAKRTLKEP